MSSSHTMRHGGAPAAVTDRLVLPVGQYVGAFHHPERPDRPRHHICRGEQVVELTEPSFAVWGFAHGPLDPIIARSTPWTRAELERYAGRAGVDDAARLTADLVARGLLAETPSEGALAGAFARTHRAVPILLGLGNTAEDPETFTIGLFDRDAMHVGEGIYDLWAWSAVDGTLWQVCQTAARLASATDHADAELTEPAGLLTLFLAGAHELLAAGAMYLDAVDAGSARVGHEEHTQR